MAQRTGVKWKRRVRNGPQEMIGFQQRCTAEESEVFRDSIVSMVSYRDLGVGLGKVHFVL